MNKEIHNLIDFEYGNFKRLLNTLKAIFLLIIPNYDVYFVEKIEYKRKIFVLFFQNKKKFKKMIPQKLLLVCLLLGIFWFNRHVAYGSRSGLDENSNTYELQYEDNPLEMYRRSRFINYLDSIRKKSILRNGPSFPFRIGKRFFMKNSEK